MVELTTQPYLEQLARWPRDGRHILAHHDTESIVVYQAYRPAIARHALAHGAFGGAEFSFARMSWIKPNFLWMMYRCGWATKEGQEVVLGIRIRRAFFDRILNLAVPSTYGSAQHETREAWQAALAASNVRLQWDPDHGPSGQPCARRAIQLGLRGELLRAFATSEILELIDMTPLVIAQREHTERERWRELQTPAEFVYQPADEAISAHVGLDAL